MRKIINIVVIFMIVIIVSSQLAYASEGVCLRVPITRDANREKEVLLKIQRREIKEKLAKLSVIKDKKPEEITEKDKEYLVEVAAYFNLWPEYLTKKENKEDLLDYSIALSILTSAELKSLDIVTANSPFTLSAIGQIGIGFFSHELGHIFRGIDSLIYYSRKIPRDTDVGKQVDKFVNIASANIQELQAWKLILDGWKGFNSLDPKVIVALLDSLISYTEKNKDLQSDITRYITKHKSEISDDMVKDYSESAKYAKGETFFTLMALKYLRESIIQAKTNSLINIGETLQKISKPYKGIYEISFQIDPRLPYFYGNPLRLSYILTNLFSNAYDAIFEAEKANKLKEGAGKVIIKIHAVQKDSKDFIEMTFGDNGIGISEEMLQDRRLFKKYDTSKKHGTGLGLYIVDQVVKECGGFIEASNKPEGGAEFTITLPVAKPDQVLSEKLTHNASSTDL
jgi:two-component sensor histidine kinase